MTTNSINCCIEPLHLFFFWNQKFSTLHPRLRCLLPEYRWKHELKQRDGVVYDINQGATDRTIFFGKAVYHHAFQWLLAFDHVPSHSLSESLVKTNALVEAMISSAHQGIEVFKFLPRWRLARRNPSPSHGHPEDLQRLLPIHSPGSLVHEVTVEREGVVGSQRLKGTSPSGGWSQSWPTCDAAFSRLMLLPNLWPNEGTLPLVLSRDEMWKPSKKRE